MEARRLADGDRQISVFADVSLPFNGGSTAFALRLPFVSLRSAQGGLGVGDVEIGLSHVVPTGRNGALVFGADVAFDTASRPDLGNGEGVATARVIIERVLPGGTILAPTIAHSTGFGGEEGRASSTRLNLYTVPALAADNLYLTIDPALTFDWAADVRYGDIAITLGYGLGRLRRADTQVFARPSAGIGPSRSFDWSIEVGFQLLNF